MMSKPADLCAVVSGMVQGSPVPVAVKMRVFDTAAETVDLALRLQATGIRFLTVHGRTIDQGRGKDPEASADWSKIAAVKASLDIPVISNGNINSLAEVRECLRVTGCDGVMSACGVLRNPALFSAEHEPAEYNPAEPGPEPGREGELDRYQLADRYLVFADKYAAHQIQASKHLFEILGKALLAQHVPQRQALLAFNTKVGENGGGGGGLAESSVISRGPCSAADYSPTNPPTYALGFTFRSREKGRSPCQGQLRVCAALFAS
jgi:tRNA-dihydrouridine synthase